MRTVGNRALFEIRPGYTLLQYQIDTLKEVYPNSEIVVTLGFEKDRVLKQLPHNVKCIEDSSYEEYGPARAVGLALRVASFNRIAIIYGDVFFSAEHLYGFHQDKSFLLLDLQGYINPDKIGVVIDRERVQHLAYGISPKFAQIAYLTGLELELAKRIMIDTRNQKLLGHELWNRVINQGGQFEPRYNQSRLIEISEYKDLNRI
jgi:hypothetical protein